MAEFLMNKSIHLFEIRNFLWMACYACFYAFCKLLVGLDSTEIM